MNRFFLWFALCFSWGLEVVCASQDDSWFPFVDCRRTGVLHTICETASTEWEGEDLLHGNYRVPLKLFSLLYHSSTNAVFLTGFTSMMMMLKSLQRGDMGRALFFFGCTGLCFEILRQVYLNTG